MSKRFFCLAALLAAVFGIFSGDASAVAALGSTGVAVGDYVTLAITALGTTVAIVVGGFVAFLVIRKGMKWAGSFAR